MAAATAFRLCCDDKSTSECEQHGWPVLLCWLLELAKVTTQGVGPLPQDPVGFPYY